MSAAPATGRGPAGRDPGALLLAAAPVLVGIVAFALARSALLPGQGFWDTGEFQAVPPLFGTAHPTGYPSYVILGWLASLALSPAGEPAFRMNLLSAILLAVARGPDRGPRPAADRPHERRGRRRASSWPSRRSPGGWAPSPTRTRSTSPSPRRCSSCSWAGKRRRRADAPGADRWLVGAAALYGVMLGNHTLTVLLAPGIALYVLAVEPGILRRRRFVGLCAGVLLATTVALYLQLPIRAAMGAPLVYGTPEHVGGLLVRRPRRQFLGDLVEPVRRPRRQARRPRRARGGGSSGSSPQPCRPRSSMVAARRPRFALLTGTWLAVTCWFAASYTNAAIDRYYLVPAPRRDRLARRRRRAASPTRRRPPSAEPRGRPAALAGAVPSRRPSSPRPRPAGGRCRPGHPLPASTSATTPPASDWSRLGPGDRRGGRRDRLAGGATRRRSGTGRSSSASGPTCWVVDDRDRLDEDLGSGRRRHPRQPGNAARLPRAVPVGDRGPRGRAGSSKSLPDPLGLQPLYRVVGPRPGGSLGAPDSGHRPAAAPLRCGP